LSVRDDMLSYIPYSIAHCQGTYATSERTSDSEPSIETRKAEALHVAALRAFTATENGIHSALFKRMGRKEAGETKQHITGPGASVRSR